MLKNWIKITHNSFIDNSEVEIIFIRSSGPGGQNVNKVATAAQLRFNIHRSSLQEDIRFRIINKLGQKITREGDIIIKASRYRSQERNKQDAIDRLIEMLKSAIHIPKKRTKTKPTRAAVEERLNSKKLRSKTKAIRSNKPSREE